MRQILYVLEYLLLIGISVLFRLLPQRIALFVAARIGDLVYYCVPVKKKLVIRNLTRSFPEKTTREIHHIARGVYRNFLKTVTGHLRLPKMDRNDILKITKFEGEENIRAALAKGKGIILIGGHFGNWEHLFMGIAAAGYPISAVAADISNPFINNFVRTNRMKLGGALLPKKGSLPKIAEILKNNGIVALAIDQDARKRGIFVDFMGLPASTVKGPARLTLSHGAALLFAIPETNKDLSITIKIKTIDTSRFKTVEADDIKELTQLCTKTLETYVRECPEQWFWLHRRWKTRPPREQAMDAAIL